MLPFLRIDDEAAMNPPKTDLHSNAPTPEMLAGVFLQVEGDEDLSVVPCRPPEQAAPGAETAIPTTEDLAGHYVLVEGVEDLTTHPVPSVPVGNGRAPAGTVENPA
jgi:hypothetical protein